MILFIFNFLKGKFTAHSKQWFENEYVKNENKVLNDCFKWILWNFCTANK